MCKDKFNNVLAPATISGTMGNAKSKIKQCKSKNHCCKHECFSKIVDATKMIETSHFGWSLTPKHQDILLTILTEFMMEYTIEIIKSYLVDTEVTEQEHDVYKGYYHKNILSFQNNGNAPCSIWLNNLPEHQVKICLLGLGAQGKTTLVHRFISNEFLEVYDPTIEDSYKACITLNPNDVDKDTYEQNITRHQKLNDMGAEYERCLVDVLDTAGQEEFMALMDEWIRSSDFFMLVFDTQDAYKSCIEIIDKIKRIKEDDFNGMMFVATKRDLVNSTHCNWIMMDTTQVIQYCMEKNIPYFETSSLNNKHVHLLFRIAVYEYWIQTEFRSDVSTC
eukprot:797624_1